MKLLSAINESHDVVDSDFVDEALVKKQNLLVSGENIKTINNQSLLGSGNITISGGSIAYDKLAQGQSSYNYSIFIGFYDDLNSYWYINNNSLSVTNSAYPSVDYVNYKVMIYDVTAGNYVASKDGINVASGSSYTTTISVTYTNGHTYRLELYRPGEPASIKYVDDSVATRQVTLVSGTNIKTINNNSLLGSGNLLVFNELPTTSSSSSFDFNDESNIGIYYTKQESYNQDFYYKASDYPGSANSIYYNRSILLVFSKKLSDAALDEKIGVFIYKTSTGDVVQTTFFKNSSGQLAKSNYVLGTLMFNTTQDFSGVKRFSSYPETTSNTNPTTDNQFTPKKYVDVVIPQKSTMPTASVDNLGTIYQFTGTTDSTYTNGYFYKCVSDGGDPATYSWQNISVQSGGGGGSSTDVQINGTSITSGGVANILTNTAYDSTNNKIATMSDLSSKQDTIDSSHKLSADLIDDTNTTKKLLNPSGWQIIGGHKSFSDSGVFQDGFVTGGAVYFNDSEDNNAFYYSGESGDTATWYSPVQFFSGVTSTETPVGNNDLTNKSYVDSVIPTNVSDLTNDEGFITGLVMLTYGTSTWNDFITAYNANKVVYCLVNNSRLAFMAYLGGNNVEFQYYRSLSSPSVTSQVDEVYVYKLTSSNSWTTTTRKASNTIAVGTGISRSYASNTRTVTLSLNLAGIAGYDATKTQTLKNVNGTFTWVDDA